MSENSRHSRYTHCHLSPEEATPDKPKKLVNSSIHSHSEESSDTASETTCQEDVEECHNSPLESSTSTCTLFHHSESDHQREDTSNGSEETTGSCQIEKDTISVSRPKTLTPVRDFVGTGAGLGVGPASPEVTQLFRHTSDSPGVLLLTAQQPKLEVDLKDRKQELTRELQEEERRKKEERLKLEQQLRTEQDERERSERKELQRLQNQEQQRINEERQEQERLQQQRLEEERQKRDFLKRQELEQKREQKRKQREEAELYRAQEAKKEKIRRQKEEEERLGRQCDFPAAVESKPVNMASTNGNPNVTPAQGAGNGQQYIPYNRKQAHRSSTWSEDTPMKNRPIRNNPNQSSKMESRNVAEAPTLFFDRLVNEEVQEMKEYSRIIQTQDREIAELKNTNNEMESRLEYQARERLELEGTLEDKEDVWAEKCRQLEQVRDENMKALQAEKTTNRKLWDLVYAKEKEIQRAYQRKVSSTSIRCHAIN